MVSVRAPDVTGAAGRAWSLPCDGSPACLASFYVHRPGAAIWTWWQMSVVHLRDVEGAEPPVRTLPGATHEFVFAALDTFGGSGVNPDVRPPNVDAPVEMRYMTPIDFVGQFAGLADAQALSVLSLTVRAVCEGVVPAPDSDRQTWWGNLMMGTVMHAMQGHHVAGGDA